MLTYQPLKSHPNINPKFLIIKVFSTERLKDIFDVVPETIGSKQLLKEYEDHLLDLITNAAISQETIRKYTGLTNEELKTKRKELLSIYKSLQIKDNVNYREEVRVLHNIGWNKQWD